jgi:hypothetical protein
VWDCCAGATGLFPLNHAESGAEGALAHGVTHAIEAINQAKRSLASLLSYPFRRKLFWELRHMSDRRLIGALLTLAILFTPACASLRGGDDGSSAASSQESEGGFLRLPSIPNPLNRSVEVNPEGIGVNSFLWRASLDTLSFMPLSEVDPFGGVIITDWYANPEMTSERFKVTVYILDTRLRADALSVNVFRQVREENGGWIDAQTGEQTAYDIENAILTTARQLRISTLED